jgi:DNA-binding LytR/AlgR family response regulator
MNAIENYKKILIGGRQQVCPDEVIMLQADINYSIIYLTDGSKLIVATTLKKLEERFSQFAFIRMNKTYMVNRQFVVNQHENALELCNSFIITFSRRRGKVWKENG